MGEGIKAALFREATVYNATTFGSDGFEAEDTYLNFNDD